MSTTMTGTSTPIGGAQAPAREGDLHREANKLREQVQRYGSLLASLYERTSEIRRLDPPCAGEGEGEEQEAIAPFADEIRALYNLVGRSNDELQRIINAIEV